VCLSESFTVTPERVHECVCYLSGSRSWAPEGSVCVCVCVREREREAFLTFKTLLIKQLVKKQYLHLTDKTRQKNRTERERDILSLSLSLSLSL